MKVICKSATDQCPKNLTICCGTCEHKDTCSMCCDCAEHYLECLESEQVDELMQFETAVPDTIEKITQLFQIKRDMAELEKQLTQKLVEAMEAYGVKSFKNDYISITYVAPTTRSTVDSTRLKEDHPELVAQYIKTSPVAASVRVKVK